MDIKLQFKKEVKDLKEYIVLVRVDSSNYQKSNIEILRLLVKEQKTPGVYVTLNKPSDIIQRLLDKEKIDQRLIIFIDAVTKVTENRKEKNCLFIGSPEKLSDISVAMDQAVNALATKDKFVFFDSVNTLELFNKPGTVARFLYFLSGKIREWKVKGIIISIKKESDKDLLNELSQFCDAEIDFGGK